MPIYGKKRFKACNHGIFYIKRKIDTNDILQQERVFYLKMMKRAAAAVLAVAVVFSATACGTLRIATEAANVEGSILTKGELMVYLESEQSKILQSAGEVEDEKEYWKTAEIDGKKAAEVAKERALAAALRVEIAAKKAAEAGITMDDATLKQLDASVHPTKASQKKQINDELKRYGLNDETFISFQTKNYLAGQYQQKVMEEDASLKPTEEEIKNKFDTDYVRVKHILIKDDTKEVTVEPTASAESEESAEPDASAAPAEPVTTQQPLTDEEKAEKKALAESVLQKAKAGEDFDQLIKEYGEDPGMESSPEGYLVYEGSGMVAPFEKASLALEVGEISDLVEAGTTGGYHGFHIIKRVDNSNNTEDFEQNKATIESNLKTEKYEAYIDGFKDSMNITVKQNVVDGIKVKELPKTNTAQQNAAGGQSVPAGGQSMPVDGQSIPVSGDGMPVDGQSMPIDMGDAGVPADGAGVPADGAE